MDLRTALLSRASPGKLTEPAPDDAQLELMLEAAVCAPDHGRLAPWRFVVLRGAAREHLATAMENDLLARHAAATAEERAAERNKALRSPLLVVVAAALHEHPKVPLPEQVMATAAAVQNFWLQAHALGFGLMWKTGAAASSARVKAALALAPTDVIVGILHLGTVAVAGTPRPPSVAPVTRRL
jgi:nitroreductase